MKLKTKKSLIILGTLFVPLMIMAAPTAVVRAATKADCVCADPKACVACAGPVMDELLIAIRFLSAMVAVVAVIMIIIGGIQYTASSGNAQAVTEAKKKISDVFIGLLAYLFLWSFLEWLIPGGLWTK